MLGNQWHRKEKPLLSLLGLGGGAGGSLINGGPTANAGIGPHNGIQATGGSSAHTFTAPDGNV